MSDPRGGSEGSHPTNETGDPEGGKTRGEAGDTTEQEKKPRRAQLNDAWFRFTTRLRAIGYWLREKAGIAWRWLKQAAEGLGYWWSRRSRGFKTRIFAVAGVVVLYLILKFLPVPGVPCEVSAAKECAPSNDTIAYVPRNADLYAHLTINSDSHQWDLAQDLHDELPNFTALLQSDTSALAIPSARPVDLSREVLPWAKDDLALVGVPGPQKTTPEAYIAGVGDEAKANQFLASLSPGGRSKKAPIGDGDDHGLRGRARHRPGRRPGAIRERPRGPSRTRREGGTRAQARGLDRRTRPAPRCPTSAWPSSTSRRRASSASSPGDRAPRPSSTPSSTTARPPAWPPRRAPTTTAWR